ncbi:hypothetical protein T10_3557 [Trichinella papuae]|uniref:Uncharacterized protein n=1 Tax=Trichinella papuae TaxID=268474 RepID=A0A0V1MXY5_9BILA|nr:hypothetical protein T10_3557 [Trichinella papuae]
MNCTINLQIFSNTYPLAEIENKRVSSYSIVFQLIFVKEGMPELFSPVDQGVLSLENAKNEAIHWTNISQVNFETAKKEEFINFVEIFFMQIVSSMDALQQNLVSVFPKQQ